MFTNVKTKKWRNLLVVLYDSLFVDLRTPPYKSVVMNGSMEVIDRPIYDFVLETALR